MQGRTSDEVANIPNDPADDDADIAALKEDGENAKSTTTASQENNSDVAANAGEEQKEDSASDVRHSANKLHVQKMLPSESLLTKATANSSQNAAASAKLEEEKKQLIWGPQTRTSIKKQTNP